MELRTKIKCMRGEKPFEKLEYPFMIKALESLGMKGVYLHKIKAAYDQPEPALSVMLRTGKHLLLSRV